jgi:hypothetical protein
MRLRAVWCLAAVACGGGGGGRTGPEREIAEDLSRQLGVPVAGVRCARGGYPKTCTAEIAGTEGLALTVADGADGLEWTLSGFVISTEPLAVQIAIELDDLGVEADVDCGPTLRVTQIGDRIQCALRGELEGAAWARIVDEEARFELELALGPDAVAARTHAADQAELERRSRALDVGDDGSDEDAEDEVSSSRCDAPCPPSSSSL